jgi:hypothetical protein
MVRSVTKGIMTQKLPHFIQYTLETGSCTTSLVWMYIVHTSCKIARVSQYLMETTGEDAVERKCHVIKIFQSSTQVNSISKATINTSYVRGYSFRSLEHFLPLTAFSYYESSFWHRLLPDFVSIQRLWWTFFTDPWISLIWLAWFPCHPIKKEFSFLAFDLTRWFFDVWPALNE